MKSPSSLKLLFSIVSLLYSLRSAISVDSITSKQSLRDNNTLISANEVFELGFFSLGKNNKYLGIWYKKTPGQVFWVANRDKPIIDSHEELVITNNGGFALLNRNSSTVWSSNSNTSTTFVPENPVLKLLDSGNLVLMSESNSTSTGLLWQSFDHPCDTLLPGMKISWNVETGQERYLTSWKSPDDPSIGDSSYRIEKTALPQLVLLVGSTKKFRFGPWNGKQFSGVTSTLTRIIKLIMGISENEWSYSFEQDNDKVFATVIVTRSGSVQRLKLSDRDSIEWITEYSVPNPPCKNYGNCGANAICRISKNPMCECLRGFVPNSSLEWREFNWSSGCKRRTNLECNGEDRFEQLSRVNFPDLLEYRVDANMTLEECKAECLRNCTCSAYANSDMKNGGSGCVMWFGNLIDMREYVLEDANQDVFLRLAASELESKKKSKRKELQIPIIVAPITFAISFLGLSMWYLLWKRESNRRDISHVGSQSKKEDIDSPIFDFATIATATKNFSDKNLLGEGGFGPVYKGSLLTGQEIAVKRLSKDSGQGIKEFTNEVLLIAKLQHRNLVTLLGYCIEGEERMLVYEYMSNKSLDNFIFGRNRSTALDWDTRFHIIMGIARGLLYLHQDSKLQIIHRDLKASNILLDADMNPKISDFGLARIFSGDEIEKKTKKVIGTYGYMSPEYAVDGKFSVKSDVFSFGVVLLEILSGQSNRGFSTSEHHHNLLGHAWILWSEGDALKFVDSSLKSSNYEEQVLRSIQVGLLCVQKFPIDRPSMVSVLLMLSNDKITLPAPKEPSFFVERSCVDVDLKSPKDVSCATFETTVTLYEGR